MLNNLQNLHTHSTFCDGKDTPEEMILAALEKGFSSLGFSGHSYMSFSPEYSMSIEGTAEYRREIARLAGKYRSEIDIFCGLEFEKYSEISYENYDYVIGSAHYFKIGNELIGFDRDFKAVKAIVDTYFGGDGMKCAKAYYGEVAELPRFVKCEILGHFDLIAKTNGTGLFFDTDSKEYLGYAFEAIDALSGKIPFFEINTGAIARGYRTLPYPEASITKYLLKKGFLPVISSDCHSKEQLDCAFEDAVCLLEECGAKERYILTKDGFKAVSLR